MSSEPARLTVRPETIYDSFAKARARTTTFDASLSPLFGRVGFVVGAPRSGTTWLQQLLFTHPLVVTGGESHLFCEGLQGVFDNFFDADKVVNLGTWVSEAELVGIARAFCDGVFLAARAGTRPDAQVIVEKTPNHRMQAALQAQLFPDGRYVHVIRDGRDATASQRRNWARSTREFAHAGEMAKAWAAEIHDIRVHMGGLAYIELRYEDVITDTPGALAAIFDHLGLPHDRALCEAAADFGRAPVHTYPSSAEVGVRKHRGDTLAERSVARAAGDLLTELGYADAAEVARLRQIRTPATLMLDSRDAALAGLRRVRAARTKVETKRRRRAKRREAAPATALAVEFSRAVEAADEFALAALLSPSVKVNGSPAENAKSAAAEVLKAIGGSRTARRAIAEGLAQVTCVTPEGKRVVVRLKPDGVVASEVDLL